MQEFISPGSGETEIKLHEQSAELARKDKNRTCKNDLGQCEDVHHL